MLFGRIASVPVRNVPVMTTTADGPGLDQLGAQLSDLLARVRTAADVPLGLADDDQALANVRLAAQLSTAAEQLTAAVVADAISRDLPARDGAASVATWLAKRATWPRPRAAGMLRLAAARARLAKSPGDRPALEAWKAGQLSGDHATVIGHTLDQLSPTLAPESFTLAEKHLVTHVPELTFDEFRVLANRVVEVVDPDAADEILGERLQAEERRAHEQATFRGRKGLDGIATFSGKIPNLHYDMLTTVLEAIASPRRDHLRGDDSEPGDDTGNCAPDLIPYGNRLGRAFCELVEKIDARDVPIASGVNATLVVTVDEQQLRDEVGAATLSTGDHISVGEARRLACGAGILPMILGGDSAPLDLGRTARLFDAHQRAALAHRDRGCVFPGCERPPAWTEAHHVTPWARGGKTDVSNGALLCGFHHRLIHAGDWDIRIAADGLPEVIPPERIDTQRRPIRHARHRQRPRPGSG
jgi:hypothetical protein